MELVRSETGVDERNGMTEGAASPLPTPPRVLRDADPALLGGRKEVVFIDSNVADWQTLVDGAKPGAEVVLLDGGGDGLAQMAAWAAGRSGYDAAHVVSHGGEGRLNLGTLTLDSAATTARASDLASLGAALTEGGDLLLYGCSIADGEGKALISIMASVTGVDVAASEDLTGAATLGGDWMLESEVGHIESYLAFPGDVMDQYGDVLLLANGGGGTGAITFGSYANETLAGGNISNSTVTSTNVKSTGLDLIASGTSTTFTLKIQSQGGTSSGSYIRVNASNGSISYLDVRANEGIFDLNTLSFGNTDITVNNGSVTYFIQALDSQYAPTGTQVSKTISSTGTWDTLDVSSNTTFDGISGLRITVSGGIHISVDSFDIYNPRTAGSDSTPPSISSVTIPNATAKIGDVVTATINVTSDTDTYTLGSSSIDGFALGSLSRVNNSTYTATFSVTSGGTDVAAASGVPVSLVLTDTAGNSNTAYTTAISQSSDRIDANRPTISSAAVNGTALTVTFNEAVSITDTTGLTVTVASATRAATYTSGTGTTTLTFTLASAVANGETVTLAYNPSTGNLTDTAANQPASISSQSVTNNTVLVDSTPPSITSVTIPDAAMKIGDVVTATILVTADSDTYTLGSSSIGGFALGGLSRTDSSTYTATFTVTSGGTDVAGSSSVPVSIVLTDAANNSNTAYTTAISGQGSDSIDATRPVISSVTIANAAMKVGDVVTATIAVAADGDTYTLGTSSIGGFTLGNLSRTDSSTYTASFTVTSGGTDVAAGSSIPVSVVLNDTAGNASSTHTTAIAQAGDAIDANAPAITGVTIPNGTAKIGDVVTATIAVTSDSDTYTLGTSSIDGFALGNLNRVNGSTYTATFTVTSGGTDVAAGSNVPVSVVLNDSAGNASATFSTAIAQAGDRIDANRPTIASATVNGTALTVTFNEAVSITDTTGLTVTVAGNTRTATYASGTGTTTLSFTLASAVTTGETVTLDYSPSTGNLTDTAGNAPASVSSQSVANNSPDNVPPSITGVSIPDAVMKIGDVVTATINVTSDSDTYTLGTSSVGGFALGGLSRSNGSTYTATFTVTSGGTDVAAGTDVPVSVVLTDTAGNSNTAYTTAISQSGDRIDANRPVVSGVTIADAAMKVGDVVTATIGVTADSDTYTLGTSTIGGFALGGLTKIGDSTYTATFTVSAGGTDVAGASSIPVSVVLTDTAGNAGSAYTTAIAGQSADAIDANAPSITSVSIPNGTAKIGDVVTATIGVSSDSDTYTLGTSSIGGFALGGLSKVGNSTYTATFTVTSGGTDVAAGSNVPVSVVLTDGAGNANATYTTAIAQASDAIDANRPVISGVSIPNGTAKIGDVVTATIGVTSDSDTYTLTSGSIGGFALGSLSRSNSSTYTATFTVTSGGTDVAAGTDVPVSIVLTDTAGNSNTAYTTPISQTGDRIDANAPVISGVTITNAAMKIGDVVTATIAVSADSDTYTLGTSSVGGFALGNLSRSNSSTYTATFTVTAGGTDVAAGSNVPVSVVLSDSAGNSSTTYSTAISQANDRIDANVPAINGVTLSKTTAMKIGDVVTATIGVTGDADTYTLGTSSVGGFTLGNLSRSNSSTYTATFTVSEGGTDVAGASDIPVSIVLTDSAGNANTAYTTAITGQSADAIDAHAPVITGVTIPNSTAKIGDVLTATISVTADSDTYTLGTDSTVGGFALGGLSKVSNSTYTATFTVTSGGTDVAANADVPVSLVLTDTAGNASSAHTTAISQTGDRIDANRPVVGSVTIADTVMKIGDVVTATIAVTADTDTYTLGTSSIGGFALGNLSKASDSTYTATFTVTAGGTDVAAAASIPLSVVLNDSAGNASTAYTTAIAGGGSDRIDAHAPAIGAVTLSKTTAMKVGDVVTATIGVTADSDTYMLGTSSVGGFALGNMSKVSDSAYTATFTVTEGGTDVAGASDIPLSIVLADSAGNTNTAYTTAVSGQASDAIDANTPVIASVSIPNQTAKIGDVVTTTISVTSDSDTYTLGASSVDGFALGNLSRSNSSTYTATFTVTSGGTDVAAGSDVPVSVVLSDTAGNSSATHSTAISQSGDRIDANRPVISTVSIPNAPMKIGDVVTATISVTSDSDTYTLGTSTIGGFTLGNLSRTDSSTYTATFTVANAGTDVAAGSSIPVSVVLNDTAGNSSATYSTAIAQAADSIDANPPSVTGVTLSKTTAMKIGDVVTATIGVTADSDTYTLGTSSVGGFALGNLNRSNASTYTATFTVTAGGADVAGAADIPVSIVLTDTAGNSNSAYTTAIAGQTADAIDAHAPVINSVTIANQTAKIGDVVTATINVTSDSDTYTLNSGSVGGFTLGNLSRVDNSTYTTTFTVTAGGTDVAAASDVPVSVVLTDTAGNSNTAYTTAISQASDRIDANRPVIANVSIVDATMKIASVVTATVSVTADSDTYTLGSGSIGGFALGNLSRSDSSTYTATFTVTSGGADVAAGADIPVSLVLTDSAGNASSTHSAAISQANDRIDANAPSITGVSIPNGTAKIGDVVTATISVASDSDTYTLYSGSVDGFVLGGLSRADSSTYTATFTVTAGGTDVAASATVPVSLVLADSAGNSSAAFTTPVAQANDRIDANAPSITGVSIPNGTAKIGDVVTATISVASDGDTCTLDSGSVGGFTLGNLSKVNDTSYTATFTVTAGGTDVAAGADIPVNLVLSDSAGNSSTAYTTAISQAADTIDANVPTLSSASPADDATGVGIAQNLVLTFSEAVQPGSGAVTLYKTGVTTAVETFAITDARVSITGSQVTLNPTATLDYSTPYYLEIASGALTDVAGNIYAGLSGSSHYNFTTEAAPPPPPQDDPTPPKPTTPSVVQTTTRTETVDGVTLQETTQVKSDGTVTQTLAIPIVTANRLEENAKTTDADIPLAKDGTGQAVLEASLPVGVGLQVDTTTSVNQPGSAKGLEGLIRAIQNRTENQPDDKSKMTGVGQVFLNELPKDVDLTVRTIIPVVADTTKPPSAPIVITGTPSVPATGGGVSQSTQQQAIVIDVRNLPKGSVIQLQNVEFAAIIGDVQVNGGAGSQVVVGDSGSQIIVLGADDDTLRGGGGNDFVGSEGGDDQLWGDEGVDTVTGGIGNDVLYGNQQDDLLYGNQGMDTLFGGQDLDTLYGGQDGDVLYGNRADDVLYGQLGDDTLFGGQSNDVLWGGQGNDVLAGNLGADTLHGGLGADVFRIGAVEEGGDVIADFEVGVDKLLVFSPNFPGGSSGPLSAQHFALDNPATTNATFVFNTRTGVLAFDADGSGAGVAVALATLNVRTLSAGDILVLGSSG